jgi:hypothetical protein
MAFVSGITGCGEDVGGVAPTPVTQLYWALTLNEHAVTLALTPPYDTIRLHAVARNANGDSLRSPGPVQYTVADSAVKIDSAGLVTAKYNTTARGKPTFVIASLQDTARHVTHVDTVFIQVTPTAPASPLTTFSIQLPTTDSAIRSVSDNAVTLTPKVLDANGVSMGSNILVAYWSSDSVRGKITSRTVNTITDKGGKLKGVRLGHVTYYATTWAYGVAMKDSLPYTYTLSNKVLVSVLEKTPYESLTPILYFYPTVITVGVGAVVTWDNQNENMPVDIVFDDTTNVDSARVSNSPLFPFTGRGNISDFYLDTSGGYTFADNFQNSRRARAFPVAGVYPYHSARYGTAASIVVQ